MLATEKQDGNKGLKIKDQDFGFLKPTSRVVIIGAAGSGKSVTMHYIAEGLHAQGTKVNMLAPHKIFELKKQGKLPSWLHLVNYKYPVFEPNTLTLYDDAQLRSFAREFYKHQNITLIKILSTARHKKAGIIITTQATREIDADIFGHMDYLIVKQPNMFQVMMDRPEFRKLEMKVFELYDKEIIGKDLNPQEYSYVVSTSGATWEGFVGPTGIPKYWCPELGDW